MATTTGSVRLEAARVGAEARPASSLRFDWFATAVCAWLVAGFYLDAWAHNHNAGVETFFTPWHGVLYSGFGAVGLFFVLNAARNRSRGYAWARSLPAGYDLSLLGVLIFSVGGPLDLLWHEVFGPEVSLEAALSPSHLLLGVGTVLILSGPLRSAWYRPGDGTPGWPLLAPALLSLTFTLSVFTVFTQFALPFVRPWAEAGLGESSLTQALGIVGIILQAGLFMGVVLFAMARWTLPFGAVTLVFGLITTLLSFMQDQYRFIPVAVAAGLAADLMLLLLKPSKERPNALRLFAFTVPVVLFALYFLVLMLTGGVGWTVELSTGSILFAGVTGVLLSLLLAPPRP